MSINRSIVFLCLILATMIHAKSGYSILAGTWVGMVTTNSKNILGGGTPTIGETGTPLRFELNQDKKALKGLITVGQVKESWSFEGDFYQWSDSHITVKTKRIPVNQVPKWMREQADLKENDQTFCFQFFKGGCSVNKTGQSCTSPEDLPQGIETSGVWVFKVMGNQLQSHVYYTYSSGGRRILEQILTKR